jgi:ribosomal protein S18 acetylase RimI-like enzyme
MNNVCNVALSNLTLRWLMQRDLPRVLEIQKQTATPGWSQQDFLTVLQSFDTTGWVAEINDRIVGFLIYMVTAKPDNAETITVGNRSQRVRRHDAGQVGKPLRLVLLNLGVSSDCQRFGVGRTLLERLARKLRHPEDSILAIVPESNLPLQLLLRDAQFKASSIMRAYFDSEDGYLMERFGAVPVGH